MNGTNKPLATPSANRSRTPASNPALSIERVRWEIAGASFARPADVEARLDAFPAGQILNVRRRLTAVGSGPWPEIGGCLVVLFTSRSGSTFLAQEVERRFKVGRMREAFRPHKLDEGKPGGLAMVGESGWFSFKAGGPSIIAAELCGFFDASLSRTSFLLLIRKNIIAQAISGVKAKQTKRWHATDKPEHLRSRNVDWSDVHPRFDHARIARDILIIASGVEKLRSYARLSGRPCRTLFYEDFASGNFSEVEMACDAFGVPRRRPGSRRPPYSHQRTADATDETWARRFREDMDASLRDRVQRYLLALDDTSNSHDCRPRL